MNRLAREVLRIATDVVNPLDNMSRSRAVRFVNKIISPLTKGVFRDDVWKGVYAIFDALDKNGIAYVIEKTGYVKNDNDVPISKEWVFNVEFFNQNGKPMKVWGTVVASGMGSVRDPLEKYDLVAYVA